MGHLEAVQTEDDVRIDVVGCRWQVAGEKGEVARMRCDVGERKGDYGVESRPVGWH